jgi:hypothetical protein
MPFPPDLGMSIASLNRNVSGTHQNLVAHRSFYARSKLQERIPGRRVCLAAGDLLLLAPGAIWQAQAGDESAS